MARKKQKGNPKRVPAKYIRNPKSRKAKKYWKKQWKEQGFEEIFRFPKLKKRR